MEDLTIGQRIAVKRKDLGMSQIDLGEAMGVSRQSVSKWEADAAIPEIDKLIALSKLFGVSIGWLLGVEQDEQPGDTPAESEFSDREWELIDRLSQPRVPKWLVPLAAVAAALALLASVLAGTALYDARKRREELSALRSALTALTAPQLPEVKLLTDWELLAEPNGDLTECTFRFHGCPVLYDEEARADLVIEQNGTEFRRVECGWDGTFHTGEFTLPTQNGFTARFELVKDDTVRSCLLPDPLLSNLKDGRDFGTVSVTWDSWGYDGAALTLEDLEFVIEFPDLLRDTPELWKKCDLAVLSDGQELGRVDILNRSPYSRESNFTGPKVCFSSRIQTIPVDEAPQGTELELVLVCDLSTGHHIRQLLKTFHPGA